jgi:integrase
MKRKKPVAIVESHNIRIPIFERVEQKKNGAEYRSFYFTQTINGTRVHKRGSTLEKAKQEARRQIDALTLDKRDTRVLTDQEFSDYSAALQIVRQYPGATLSAAIGEWSAAMKALGGGSIVAACEAQQKATQKRSGFTQMLVATVYDEFIASLERDGASDRYIEDCKSRMGQIRDTFKGYIHAVDQPDLERWLESKKISFKTRKNYRTAAVTLWRFAKDKGYLPRDQQTEAELIPIRKRTKAAKLSADIGVYDPADLRKILTNAPAHLRAVFAIGAFAGLRTSELCRLKWGHIHPSYIQVFRGDSKTAVRRHAPVTVALKEWLATCKKGELDQRISTRHGHMNALARAMTKAVRDAGVEPVHNGLRHTFCSARVAVTNDLKQTAKEAGNSVRVIDDHYVKVMTRAKGAAWFAVRPASGGKVVAFAA